jgi:hypothetical protein
MNSALSESRMAVHRTNKPAMAAESEYLDFVASSMKATLAALVPILHEATIIEVDPPAIFFLKW